MADELSEKIKSLLSDPESLKKVTAIASSLGMTDNSTPPPTEEKANSPPVLLPGKSHGQRSLVGCSPWGR